MPLMAQLSSRRWPILAFLLLVSMYAYRKPFSGPAPGPAATPQIKQKELEQSEHIPLKLYEASKLQTQAGDFPSYEQPMPDKFPENPKAPSFPAFTTSADKLKAQLYNPYPDYNSKTWQRVWKGVHRSCNGPRGVQIGGHPPDMLFAYKLDENSTTPKSMFGSHRDTALDSDFCFDRYARYDAYGFDDEQNPNPSRKEEDVHVAWSDIDWAALQNSCLSINQERYEDPMRTNRTSLWYPMEQDIASVDQTLHFPLLPHQQRSSWFSAKTSYKQRSGVVLHMTAGATWTIDTTQYVRSLVMELALHSGAEYEIIVLLELEHADEAIYDDVSLYEAKLSTSVPKEFADLTVLYDQALLQKWYPNVGKSGYDSDSTPVQPLQLLSLLRPDLEYFWSVNPSARYTGHQYQHLETLSHWSTIQPRRLMWERSSTYYLPGLNGNWSSFSEMVGNTTHIPEGGVWGPVQVAGIEPIGPEPPFPSGNEDLKYSWGIDEPADLITTGPIIEQVAAGDQKPRNYPDSLEVPIRRLTSTILTRYSKRLLRVMHYSQVTLGLSMETDQFAVSTALHHGLKAVAVPIPIYLDYAKIPSVVDEECNYRLGAQDGGNSTSDPVTRFKEISGRLTFWDDEKTSQPGFADELYKRWLGYGKDPNERLCLPGILLHPIKGV